MWEVICIRSISEGSALLLEKDRRAYDRAVTALIQTYRTTEYRRDRRDRRDRVHTPRVARIKHQGLLEGGDW